MRAVVQRVLNAQVEVGPADAREIVADMGQGLLVFLGVGHADAEKDAHELMRKIIGLRVFEDAQGKMNESLTDVGGTLGLVSQFTLWADVRKGRRPSFGEAADPAIAKPLFDAAVTYATEQDVPVVTGCFGEHMKVSLVNDGPMTLLIYTERRF